MAGGKDRRKGGKHSAEALKVQSDSIAKSTRLPVSLQQSTPEDTLGMKPPKSLSNIKDKKLRSDLSKQYISRKRAERHAELADEYLHGAIPGEEAGMIEPENEMERTARVTQAQIQSEVGVETARKGFELHLGGGRGGTPSLGPYRLDYTRNGRHLLLGGRKGHLAAFDWQSGKLSCEIQVRETVRDVCWLHDQSFFAAAQKKYTYIYDQNGLEIHRLKDHIEVNRLQFLPYHFLLASVGKAGYLKYQDTSTGQLVASHRTGLGSCATMAQNPLTAVIHLGHANGTVTLWTPNLSTPAIKMLAHRGPVSGIAINAHEGGREMVTGGLDGHVKVWDMRMLGKGPRREWITRRPPSDVAYSQRGLLGVAWGSHVSMYHTQAPLGAAPPGPYLTHNFAQEVPLSLRFCPYEDVLGVGRASGFSSVLVPGSGEPTFDSSEADPFETKARRREREVRSLLDKIQPEMITVDPTLVGQLDTRASRADQPVVASGGGEGVPRAADGTPYARLTRAQRLQLDAALETEADADLDADEAPAVPRKGVVREKNKARGRNASMKKYLRKKRQNVVDANTTALREKYRREKERARHARHGTAPAQHEPSALDVFANVRGPRK
ncbi:putative U3 small nucleolar RNA-associated protein 7 [Malassezia furfur]|uniref:U3 small nucleolar RNA-associated protein 7 n=1 Tax=Malassezia furfur TaxID=55194 RepID=A0ABY8EMJ3_MALFU|nr:utp7 [Malassezia furfur]WFD45680.1 putative U3 small nucleolar RNA-associated protein 7 [Malassezia furfur]